MIKKILIANRGEIARRIIRTARAMNIKTVAVYSQADEHALHRLDADESYLVGAAPSSESYLNQDKIIEIAQESGCNAIHPGYGFLSENALFADKVSKSGLIFIGPSARSIQLMGDKLAAKKLALSHGVPLLPGTENAVTDLNEAKDFAREINYPVILKAAGGGGGKGMRIVRNDEQFKSLFELATSEARQSFGDHRVFVEKYLESPKHIEVQIMADTQGNVVHVFERDCSIQRRHQKVVEETPAPTMSNGLRAKMTDSAIELAKACQYVGAGTVEFLVDAEDNFYFLEMNTRLQVEHPVTECISGIDLVEWQILIADGQPLPVDQTEIKQNGHSIQLRIYAEDVLDDFAPSLGTIQHYREPSGKHIRIDGAAKANYDIPIYYDPMLSKLIVWGRDREAAISLINHAITQYEIQGINTTLPLGAFVFSHPEFQDGSYTTHFINQHYLEENWMPYWQEKAKVAAYLATVLRRTMVQKPQENRNSKHWLNARK